jgi:ribosomal protein S18 acetylase RimI-like enzyme
VQPGSAAARRWVGLTEAGVLLACAADTSSVDGVGHLSSIAVHPDARGKGLGRAVTASLTRRLLEEGRDVVTLGMYADNAAGRAMYDALGFRDEHRFTSGPLEVRSRW